MKITKQQLKQLIKEETQDVLKEFEPKQPDHQLSPAELAQRRATQAQMKTTAAKKAAKLGDVRRRPKRQRQDPRVSNYWDSEEEAKAHQRAKAPAAANLEDIEMYDYPIQGAEPEPNMHDLARAAVRRYDGQPTVRPAGPDLRKAALETRPGMGPSAISDEEAKAKRPKRTRYNEANFTKQQLEQIIQEELQSVIQEENKVYDARQELNSVFSLIKKAADLMSDLQANVYNKGYSNEKALLDLAAEIYHVSRLTKQGLAKANGVRGGL